MSEELVFHPPCPMFGCRTYREAGPCAAEAELAKQTNVEMLVPLTLGHEFWRGQSKHDRCRVLLSGETTCGQPRYAHQPSKESR